MKSKHRKAGVELKLFKAMSTQDATISSQTSLRDFVEGGVITPSAKRSINDMLATTRTSVNSATVYKKPSFASRCRPLTTGDRRQFKVKDEDFKFIYEEHGEFQADFRLWLIDMMNHSEPAADQIVKNLREIWNCVDPTLSLHPNRMRDVSAIEDQFFLERFRKLKSNTLRWEDRRTT